MNTNPYETPHSELGLPPKTRAWSVRFVMLTIVVALFGALVVTLLLIMLLAPIEMFRMRGPRCDLPHLRNRS